MRIIAHEGRFLGHLRIGGATVLGHPVLAEDNVSRDDATTDAKRGILAISAIRRSRFAILDPQNLVQADAANRNPQRFEAQGMNVADQPTGRAFTLARLAQEHRVAGVYLADPGWEMLSTC